MSMAEISRRRFIQAFGAVAATSSFALAGCGAQRASEADGSAAAGGTADTITFAQGADPRGLDPAYVDDGESAKIMCNIYDTLLRYDTETCDIVPGLAELPDVSDDGLTYTFTLQEGVKFHDGTDCNAEAVMTSIVRQLEPERTEDMPYASLPEAVVTAFTSEGYTFNAYEDDVDRIEYPEGNATSEYYRIELDREPRDIVLLYNPDGSKRN